MLLGATHCFVRCLPSHCQAAASFFLNSIKRTVSLSYSNPLWHGAPSRVWLAPLSTGISVALLFASPLLVKCACIFPNFARRTRRGGCKCVSNRVKSAKMWVAEGEELVAFWHTRRGLFGRWVTVLLRPYVQSPVI